MQTKRYSTISFLGVIALGCTSQRPVENNQIARIATVNRAPVPATSPASASPAPIAPSPFVEQIEIDPVVDLDASSNKTCVVRSSGSVYCWGDLFAHVGEHVSPELIGGVQNARQVSCGRFCAVLTRGGLVLRWRSGEKPSLYTPIRLAQAPTSITTGADLCWIDSSHHGLCVYPRQLAIDSAKQIAAAMLNGCGVSDAGEVWCWGSNSFGQLDASGKDSKIPVRKESLRNVEKVAVSDTHLCALLKDGHVTCWGSNRFGELGQNPEVDAPPSTASRSAEAEEASTPCFSQSSTPQIVKGLGKAVDVSAGMHFSCAVLENGEVRCWGSNWHGLLGDGTSSDRYRPTKVIGIGPARAISGRDDHACVILTTGGVACWGDNHQGQLGDGVGMSRLTPVVVHLP